MLVFNVSLDVSDLPYRQIIAFAETQAVTGDVLKEFIITRLLEDTNVLARICEEAAAPGDGLRAAALADIRLLLAPVEPGPLAGYVPSIKRQMRFAEYQQSLAAIVAMDAPEEILEGIIAHYRTFGGGSTAKYTAFLWDQGLCGIERPDDIALDQLFCLAEQKQTLLQNTRAFLAGQPFNNVLLYGNSGCGKSSMVKAILSEHYRDGLRLVQLRKENLAELPLLIRQIKDRRLRYIIFMDDLSFESDDIGYKTLKTILDGGIERQPENIVFYATSNRLHLISETWAERSGDDVHVTDTRNEKMSLAERFGIRISFLSPGQQEYLDILAGILGARGIVLTEEMKTAAVNWAWQLNGLSGRTAMQYVYTILPSLAKEQAAW